MLFSEACQSAKDGNFVSNQNFDQNQSMHEYNGSFYYEDGANLTLNGFINVLPNGTWSREGWFVKYSKEQVNKDKLQNLHDTFKDRMLPYDRTYEECIVR